MIYNISILKSYVIQYIDTQITFNVATDPVYIDILKKIAEW